MRDESTVNRNLKEAAVIHSNINKILTTVPDFEPHIHIPNTVNKKHGEVETFHALLLVQSIKILEESVMRNCKNPRSKQNGQDLKENVWESENKLQPKYKTHMKIDNF